jgi:hypothetical protein
MTVTPDDHDDEEQLRDQHRLHDESEDELERRQQPRPGTPEPMHGYPTALRSRDGSGSDDEGHAPAQSRPNQNDAASEEFASRLATLTAQLETALTLSRTLQERQTAAQSTIEALEDKVRDLEEKVAVKTLEEPALPVVEADTTSSQEQIVTAAKAGPSQSPLPISILELESVKTEWANMRTEWSTMEGRVKRVEDSLQGVVTDQERHRQEWERERQRQREREEREQGIGLVTPPSPRSLSSDSMGKSNGKRKRKTRSVRKEKEVADTGEVEKEDADHEDSEDENGVDRGRVAPVDDSAKGGGGGKSNFLENGHGNGSGSGYNSSQSPRAVSPSTTLLSSSGVSSSLSSLKHEKSLHMQPHQDHLSSPHSEQKLVSVELTCLI